MATYREPENILEIKDECDVLVIGGGAAGHSAAIAAARAGAEKVIIVERYDFMGNMNCMKGDDGCATNTYG